MINQAETYLRDVRNNGKGDWYWAYGQIRFGMWKSERIFIEYSAHGCTMIIRWIVKNPTNRILTHAWSLDNKRVKRYNHLKVEAEGIYNGSSTHG